MRFLMVFFAVLLIMESPAQAGARTGNELLADCQTGNVYSDGFCLGYVSGVIDSILGDDFLSKMVCLPNRFTAKQAEDLVKKYLTDTPNKRHALANDLIFVALYESFPCG